MIRRIINIDDEKCNGCGAITFEERDAPAYDEAAVLASKKSISQLAQWPCQIKLVPVSAPYFKGAELLIAADCTAYAHGNFHNDFMKGKITLIGCPKLDAVVVWKQQLIRHCRTAGRPFLCKWLFCPLTEA